MHILHVYFSNLTHYLINYRQFTVKFILVYEASAYLHDVNKANACLSTKGYPVVASHPPVQKFIIS